MRGLRGLIALLIGGCATYDTDTAQHDGRRELDEFQPCPIARRSYRMQGRGSGGTMNTGNPVDRHWTGLRRTVPFDPAGPATGAQTEGGARWAGRI